MEIFRKKLETEIKAKDFNLTDYISYEHFQDCCENVYIDFEHIDIFREQINELETINEISINWVEWEWIVVFLYNWDDDWGAPKRVGVFLACRNSQNWYYSGDLDLIVDIDGVITKIDLRGDTDFVLDDIG